MWLGADMQILVDVGGVMSDPADRAVCAIRPATAADQATIRAIVRAGRINPFGLAWSRFLVAERAGVVIGVGQIKPHRDRSRELASIAVAAPYQGQGIGGALIQALLAQATPPLFLICLDRLTGYYRRFGFQPIAAHAMPPGLRRIQAFMNRLFWLTRRAERLFVMRWDGARSARP
jgi:N-acetylglutamate synthase-like GNAT family acetyltransferase